ncbi:capsid cement protein [Paenirhodobacter populi]|uniref:DUF2190 family protein n=1 Tax=Paenirhodobacter populi TaxID=2306993 RepID=A0A443J1F8_9RHOB|nr:capsid cement protein [Sinirhodobacter populi]RWR14249.1 hypothetical protein D2T33_03255 [Sinirhodobacter populi]
MFMFHDVLSWTVIPTGLFEAADLISFAGAKITTEDAPVFGVAKHPCTVIGDPTAVMAIGIARVKASGAVTVGAKLISAAGGGVKVAGAGAVNVFSTALTAAADGGFVDIIIR